MSLSLKRSRVMTNLFTDAETLRKRLAKKPSTTSRSVKTSLRVLNHCGVTMAHIGNTIEIQGFIIGVSQPTATRAGDKVSVEVVFRDNDNHELVAMAWWRVESWGSSRAEGLEAAISDAVEFITTTMGFVGSWCSCTYLKAVVWKSGQARFVRVTFAMPSPPGTESKADGVSSEIKVVNHDAYICPANMLTEISASAAADATSCSKPAIVMIYDVERCMTSRNNEYALFKMSVLFYNPLTDEWPDHGNGIIKALLHPNTSTELFGANGSFVDIENTIKAAWMHRPLFVNLSINTYHGDYGTFYTGVPLEHIPVQTYTMLREYNVNSKLVDAMNAAKASIPNLVVGSERRFGYMPMTMVEAQLEAVKTGNLIKFQALVRLENIVPNNSGGMFTASFCVHIMPSGRKCNKTTKAGFKCIRRHNQGPPHYRYQMRTIMIDVDPTNKADVTPGFTVVVLNRAMVEFMMKTTPLEMRAKMANDADKASYRELLMHDKISFDIYATCNSKGQFTIDHLQFSAKSFEDPDSPICENFEA